MTTETEPRTYPDGVWETTDGLTDAEARMDWPVLRDAPGYQFRVTGPSGRIWTWRMWPSVPGGTFREIPTPTRPGRTSTEGD